jgi:trans-aconitate methyltransferase
MTLHEWGLFHKTDKATAHKYLDFYEARIGEPKSIIEFGVLNGSSLKMWRDRYPGATVIGLDIDQKTAPEGTYFFKLDASKENWITKISPQFDLIIDDASHFTLEQVDAFDLWWPLVAKGGKYIIEDCHTMHYTHYNPVEFDFKKWVEGLGIKHEYFLRTPGDESDSMTLILYK